jgi:hypothetical protein
VAGTGGDGGVASCAGGDPLIFTVSGDERLSTFDPRTRAFHDIATLDCPSQLCVGADGQAQRATPFSMAIDRQGTAYVLYCSGYVRKVDTRTGACMDTNLHSSQTEFEVFAMGFASDTVDSPETLYVAGGLLRLVGMDSANFGRMDINTFRAQSLGETRGWPELTGTGDGHLWGFFPGTDPPRIAEIDRTSGRSMPTAFDLSDLGGDPPGAWAFAAWGGDFYVFLRGSGAQASSVYQVRKSDGHLTRIVDDADRNIVGAGVSTCAPTVP